MNNYVKHLEGQLTQSEQQQLEESSLEQHPLEASLQNLSIDIVEHTLTDESEQDSEGEINLADTQELLSMSLDDEHPLHRQIDDTFDETDTRELLQLDPDNTDQPRRTSHMNDLFDSLTNFPSNEPWEKTSQHHHPTFVTHSTLNIQSISALLPSLTKPYLFLHHQKKSLFQN